MDPGLLARIAGGRTDLVMDWVAAGGAATALDPDGVSLLCWAAYYGDVTAVRWLVTQGAPLSGLGGNLDLNGAAFHGHWRLVEYLLGQGADPNHPMPGTGETPLHAALAKAGRPATGRVVAVLIAGGADPRRATTPGAPTDCFMRDCLTRGETPLHRAAAFADAPTVERLLRAGADREARDAHGDSPLAWASWHLRPDRILRLLCFGPHRIHPDRDHPGDHGQGATGMDEALLGRPGA